MILPRLVAITTGYQPNRLFSLNLLYALDTLTKLTIYNSNPTNITITTTTVYDIMSISVIRLLSFCTVVPFNFTLAAVVAIAVDELVGAGAANASFHSL